MIFLQKLWHFLTSPVRYMGELLSSKDAASCMRFCMVMVCASVCFCMVKALVMRFDSGAFWGAVAGILATVFGAKAYQYLSEMKKFLGEKKDEEEQK